MGDDKQDPDQKQADDELAARRQKQAESDAEAAAGVGGKSVEDMEKDGDLNTDEEADGQFAFDVPTPRGKELKWQDLVPKNLPVEHRVAMGGASIANPRGGLLDPHDLNGLLLVSYVLDHYRPQYIRDNDGKVTKVVIYAVIKPKHVVNARSEAGETLLHGEAAA